jgi:hypothetical protein
MFRRGFVRCFGAMALLGLGGLACGSNSSSADHGVSTPMTQTFVGSVDETDALVGLVVTGSDALLFVCGESSLFATTTRWFSGTVAPGKPVSMSASPGTGSATATVTSNGASGTFTLGGSDAALHWTAALPVAGTLTGVYTDNVSQGDGYLIVQQLAPSDAPVAVGAFQAAGDEVLQVIPLRPIVMTSEGIEATVELKAAPVLLNLLAATATPGS